jgi:hypothetical protein
VSNGGANGEAGPSNAGAAGDGNVEPPLLRAPAWECVCLLAISSPVAAGGAAGGLGLEARLDTPEGMVADTNGNIYVAEQRRPPRDDNTAR